MITFVHSCPYCGVENGGFEVVNFSQREYDHVPIDIYAILATCNHCGKGIVANCGVDNRYLRDKWGMLTSQTPSDTVLQKLKHHQGEKYQLEEVLGFMPEFEPKQAELDIPTYLPQQVNDKMRAAEKHFLKAEHDADFLDAAGTAYRKTLEVALAVLDTENRDKNLNCRINSLVHQGLLVKSMGDFAHRIRSLGNDATHDEITLDELKELRLFTQLFLQYAFTLPAMIPDEIKE